MVHWFKKTDPPLTADRAGLATLLDQVIKGFPPAYDMMAEVMVATATANTAELVTWDLRPATSQALYFRLRAGEGIAGTTFQTGRAFAGSVTPQDQSSKAITASDAVAHLLSTRSALAVPLIKGATRIAVLNLESPVPGAFGEQALEQLRGGPLLALIANEVGRIETGALTSATVVRSLIDKLREKIAFAINPDSMTDTYYQVLRVAGQVVRPSHVSGGLILVRDAAQKLVSGANADKLFAVRAARIGAFDSDTEWELQGQSIARRIMRNRVGEVIPNARQDPDYRDSGTGLEETSELIVPLVSAGTSVGVIGLVSPGLSAFNSDDLASLTAVAEIAVYAVTRSEEIRKSRRDGEQLACSHIMLDLLSPLFPREAQQITLEDIAQVRNAVSGQILTWAAEKTGAEHGTFVLADTNEKHQTYLAIHENRTPDPVRPEVPRRWLATRGVTGQAFTERRTVYQPDVSADPAYISYFEQARSEVTAPLRIGDEVLGVLDVESKYAYHFTSDHIQWVEFLAEQAAFALATIDRAVKTYVELKLADLSRKIDDAIERMRKTDDTPQDGDTRRVADLRLVLREVRDIRNEEILNLITELLPLTRSWVGRFLVGLNIYTKGDTHIDERHGQLYYLVSTDPNEVARSEDRFFPLSQGVSSRAFVSQQQIVFNDKESRPSAYFDSDRKRDSLSGIFCPVWEGPQISGVLNIENPHEGAFTPETIRACQLASDLASKLVSAARLRIIALLRERLRDYEFEILGEHTADLTRFMNVMLTRSAFLSNIEEGWGTIVLLNQPEPKELEPKEPDPNQAESKRTEPTRAPVAETICSMTYAAGATEFTRQDDQTPITYPAFMEAMREQRPVLILDTARQDPAERVGAPWSDAVHSVICVPLLRPREGATQGALDTVGGSAAQLDTVGVLALSHRNLAEFSEYDKEILSLFAETIVSGLKDIALLQARKDLMRRVRHDFSEAVKPLTVDTETIKRRLAYALEAPDLATARQHIQGVREVNQRADALVFLFTDLMTWFFDLSNGDLRPEADPSATMTAQEVVKVQERPVDALAMALKERTVRWAFSEVPIYIQGGETRARMIRAALFQYLDNAIKYGEDDTITVSVSQEGHDAVFAVRSAGEPIPERDREQIYQLYYRGNNAVSDDTGSGIGLFQVKEIAHRLGGDAAYLPDPTAPRQNIFYFTVPARIVPVLEG